MHDGNIVAGKLQSPSLDNVVVDVLPSYKYLQADAVCDPGKFSAVYKKFSKLISYCPVAAKQI